MNIRHNLGRFAGEAARALRNFKYELAGDKVYFPGAKIFVGGVFRDHFSPAGSNEFIDTAVNPNRLVTEGLIYLLNAAFAGQSQINQFYIAPFAGNVSPAAGWTGATFAAQATEFTNYNGATRLPWNVAAASGVAAVGNTAALADSTMTFSDGGPYTVYGLGLLAASAKGATTGQLIAATRFGAPRSNMQPGDRLALEYVLNAKDEAEA